MPLASHASDGPARPFAKAMEVIWVRMMERGLVFDKHRGERTSHFKEASSRCVEIEWSIFSK